MKKEFGVISIVAIILSIIPVINLIAIILAIVDLTVYRDRRHLLSILTIIISVSVLAMVFLAPSLPRKKLFQNAERYEGEWVRISGTIYSIQTVGKAHTGIILSGGSGSNMIIGACMDDQERETMGEKAYYTVVGRVYGKTDEDKVMLVNVYFDETEETAEQSEDLAEEWDELENLESKAEETMEKSRSLFGTSEIDRDNALQVTARELYQEFEANQVTCKNKHSGYASVGSATFKLGESRP